MSKDIKEANPSVDDGSLKALDCGRALCFGRVFVVAPKKEAGISIDDRHQDTNECQDAKPD